MVQQARQEHSGSDGTHRFHHLQVNPSKYVKVEQKHKYEYKIRNFTQEGREKFLIGMMKVNFLKRLESCVHSFAVSMERTVGKIDDLQKKIRSFKEYRAKAEMIDLDRYISLKDRVEARMALVDITATADDNLLQEEIRDLIEGDLKYRDKQLKKLRDEILDLEDVTDGVSLSEFTLDDFRIELANYIEANRLKLESAPLGLYAVVPAPVSHPVIRLISWLVIANNGSADRA